jgi:hypothetical protein
MGVMLQGLYWDCPKAENREHQWWVFIKSDGLRLGHNNPRVVATPS